MPAIARKHKRVSLEPHRLLAVFVVAACGGGGGSSPPVVQNASSEAKPQCSVIPEGSYMFKGAPTLDELMGMDDVAGHCTTGFEDGVQVLRCDQLTPPLQLHAKVWDAGDLVELTSPTYFGKLEYSDAVVLLGRLRSAQGAFLDVRLELEDCTSVEACQDALVHAKRCH
jgi:hypothetical protein